MKEFSAIVLTSALLSGCGPVWTQPVYLNSRLSGESMHGTWLQASDGAARITISSNRGEDIVTYIGRGVYFRAPILFTGRDGFVFSNINLKRSNIKISNDSKIPVEIRKDILSMKKNYLILPIKIEGKELKLEAIDYGKITPSMCSHFHKKFKEYCDIVNTNVTDRLYPHPADLILKKSIDADIYRRIH